MDDELLARDLMDKNFASLSRSALLRDAALLLQAARELDGAEARSLVVLDEDGAFAGAVSMITIIEAVTPEFMKESPHLGPAAWEGLFAECIEGGARMKVEDVMHETVGTVREDSRLPEIMLAIASGRIPLVPVAGEDKKVIGVIRLPAVFGEIAKRFARMS